MKTTNKDTIRHIAESNDINYLVSILELVTASIDIETISGMAAKENKTPRGIKTSNRYKKIEIGRAKLAIKGVECDNMPF